MILHALLLRRNRVVSSGPEACVIPNLYYRFCGMEVNLREFGTFPISAWYSFGCVGCDVGESKCLSTARFHAAICNSRENLNVPLLLRRVLTEKLKESKCSSSF